MSLQPTTEPTIEALRQARAVIEYCYERGWTDGLPVVPPAEEFVEQFLAQRERDPEEVLIAQEHLGRKCTVRLAAANAVMAGCKPEYFPIVIAALEGLNQLPGSRGLLQSTTGQAELLVLNGPIRQQLGFNSRDNVLSPGDRPNVTVGRAIRLAMENRHMNALGIRPHEFDQSTQRQPGKLSLCIAEDEEESPWEPLHVEKGHDPKESTVTVAFVRGTMQIEQQDSKQPEVIPETIANSMSYTGTYFPTPRGHAGIMIMGPEHAHLLAEAGWNKSQAREYLWQHFGRPAGLLRRLAKDALVDSSLSDEAFVHFANSPAAICLIVAGARNAGISTICPTFIGQTVTIPIR